MSRAMSRNALRTGSQTEADGRVLGVLLDVIGALLDSSTLFVEPYVSYPTDRLPLLTRPPIAAPIPTTRPVYSTPSIATAHTLDTSTHLGGADDVAPPDTTFHDVSLFGSPHHEDPDPGASFDWQESGYPRRCHSESR